MKKFYFILLITTLLSIVIFIHPLTNYFESKYKYSVDSQIKNKEVYSVSKHFSDYLNSKNEDNKNEIISSFKFSNLYENAKISLNKIFNKKQKDENANEDNKSQDNKDEKVNALIDNILLNYQNNNEIKIAQEAKDLLEQSNKIQENEISDFAQNNEHLKIKSPKQKDEQIKQANDLINQIQLTNKSDINEQIVQTVQANKNNKNKKVLLIGDSLMHALASSLVSDLNAKGFSVTNLSKSSTGLTNKEFYNWENVLRKELSKNSYQTIITIFGSNDAYSIFEKNKKLSFPSLEWSNFYKNRIDEILKLAKNNNAQMIWLETPCMRSPNFDKKIKILNNLFKEKLQEYNFSFFTTRDKICQNDTFIKVLSNKVIRNDDGIHINKTGSSILSKEIIKTL